MRTTRYLSILGILFYLTAANPRGYAEGSLNFLTQEERSSWTFDNALEYPGAQGSISFPVVGSQPLMQINIDFSAAASNPALDPRYVLATTPVNQVTAADVGRVRLSLQASDPVVKPRLRIYDSSGQILQYIFPTFAPLTNTTTDAPVEALVDLTKPTSFWGGANNGVIQRPILRVGILADARGFKSKATLRVGPIELVGTNTVPIISNSARIKTPQNLIDNLLERTGVSVHFRNDERSIALIKASGLKWIRTDLLWSTVERNVGTYNFSEFDKLVSDAENNGLKVLAILDYGHPGHTGGSKLPPRTTAALSAWSNFCKAAATRYKGRPVAFEIWNEPDKEHFWGMTPNAVDYSAVLRAATTAIRTVDANVLILSAGLSSPNQSNFDYWKTISQQNSFTGVNGLGTHLYISEGPEFIWANLLKVKAIASSYIVNGKAWCTEWGYSSTWLSAARNGHETSAREKQGSYTVRQLLVNWWADLPMTILYDLRDDGTDPTYDQHNFGLVNADYSDKPAMIATRTLLTLVNGRKLGGMINHPACPKGLNILRFDGPSSKLYAVWIEDHLTSATVRIDDRRARFWDRKGERLVVDTSTPTTQFTLNRSQDIVYIEIPN